MAVIPAPTMTDAKTLIERVARAIDESARTARGSELDRLAAGMRHMLAEMRQHNTTSDEQAERTIDKFLDDFAREHGLSG